MKLVCLVLLVALAASNPVRATDPTVPVVSTDEDDSSSPIKHILVLMMENRSFDHLLGWLTQDWSSKVEGLLPGHSCPYDPSDPTKGSVPITRGGYDKAPDDPHHDFKATAKQINHNKMNGFVADAVSHHHNTSNPVSMFDSVSAPIINSLARNFAVFDHWFCSLPGPTDPNRAFAMSGTSLGMVTNFNGTRWTQQSYFDYLRKHNRSFAAYYQDDPWAVMYFQDTHHPANSKHIHELEPNFYNDVAAGKLADFTWLQPRMHASKNGVPTWQHPDASVVEGERLIKKVYEALRNGPKWNSTLLMITYDEHGGFYDHVVPPHKGVPSPDGFVASNGFKFDRLGVRIPTIAISPWVNAGTIVSKPLPAEQPTATSAFDATSTLATANKILKVKGKPLSKRMAWANTFAGLFTQRQEPRDDCPLTLAELPPTAPTELEEQRAKPLNDHLECQIRFYCSENHAEDEACYERALRELDNQGKVADWILDEVAVHQNKLRLAEMRASASVA